MRKLTIIVGALALGATLASGPVFAQSYSADYGTGNLGMVNPVRAQVSSRGTRVHAYVPRETGAMRRSDQVFVDGNYVGQDPDPNVRLELRRDYPLR